MSTSTRTRSTWYFIRCGVWRVGCGVWGVGKMASHTPHPTGAGGAQPPPSSGDLTGDGVRGIVQPTCCCGYTTAVCTDQGCMHRMFVYAPTFSENAPCLEFLCVLVVRTLLFFLPLIRPASLRSTVLYLRLRARSSFGRRLTRRSRLASWARLEHQGRLPSRL